MTQTFAPIRCIFLSDQDTNSPIPMAAWDALQAALGQGLCTALLTTPETRGTAPRCDDFASHPAAPADNEAAAARAFDELTVFWRFAFEAILNRRWDLVDNPYAKIWILPGMLLLHEDPLGWVVDAASADLAEGAEYGDEPRWAIIMPHPSSNHAALGVTSSIQLPHADILSRALTEAAESEGHGDLGTLIWAPVTPEPGAFDVISI